MVEVSGACVVEEEGACVVDEETEETVVVVN